MRVRLINLGIEYIIPSTYMGSRSGRTGHEGARRRPEALWSRGNTALVGVAQARDIEFVANRPGDWMLHCHLPHHMMNQMSSTVGRMTREWMRGQGAGCPPVSDMKTGMGMLQGTPPVPMGDDYGASLGRGMGVASD